MDRSYTIYSEGRTEISYRRTNHPYSPVHRLDGPALERNYKGSADEYFYHGVAMPSLADVVATALGCPL